LGCYASIALTAITIGLKIGDLRGLALQTTDITQIEEKLPISEINASGNDLKDQQDIKLAISSLSQQYGLNENEFLKVVECESNFNPNADNGVSRGISQFVLSTWKRYCGEKDERFDAYKSLECQAKMWQKGLKYHWDCWCLLYGKDNLKCKRRGF